MPARCLAFAFLLSIAGPAGSSMSAARAGELDDLLRSYRADRGPFGTVYSHPSERRERDEVSAEIASALARVEGRLSRTRGRPFQAVLAPGAPEFSRIYRALTGQRAEGWIAGVAFPDLDLLVVRGEFFSFLRPPGDRPRAVLEHELAHLVIHRHPGVPIPRWLDEGLSQWTARQFPGPEDEAFLSGLARVRALYPLEALDREMPKSHDQATLAYQESVLWVEWLRQRFGGTVTGDLLDSLERGEWAASALEARTGLTIPQLEAGFRIWLAGRRSLGEVVIQVFNFWTLISLLALVAIARSVWKNRRKLREMEREEGPEDPAGGWRREADGRQEEQGAEPQ